MTSKRSPYSGFTLLEILLVIMVIGIATAAFLPTAIGAAENARTRSALRELIAINRYARSRAILERKPIAVVYYENGETVQMLSMPARRDAKLSTLYDQAPEEADSEAVELIRSQTLPKFVSIQSVKGAEQEEGNSFVVYKENGISISHSIKVLDPKGQIHQLNFNGLTGEIAFED
ncbi:prepilin-type N-terminal cleavage/methylation domain-containing protein [Kiritimatiellota bacterium B12222]|nr:prepilin-type N-terminal cleavage/methylation domain-containing protein [Kiritimatiellota bacterium B12222]